MSLHRTSLDWKDNCEGSSKDSGDNDLCFVEPEYFWQAILTLLPFWNKVSISQWILRLRSGLLHFVTKSVTVFIPTLLWSLIVINLLITKLSWAWNPGFIKVTMTSIFTITVQSWKFTVLWLHSLFFFLDNGPIFLYYFLMSQLFPSTIMAP